MSVSRALVLAGGRGSRLGGEVPKPLVEVEGRPMLWWVLRMLARAGVTDATIATGHAADAVERWAASQDARTLGPSLRCEHTGLDAGTGARVRAAVEADPDLCSEPFLLAWCDGLTVLDLPAMEQTHACARALVTMLAVHPPSRFGHVELEGDLVRAFVEKPEATEAWVSGGVFLVEPQALDRLPAGAAASWERDLLPAIARERRLAAHRHTGPWRCLDDESDRAAMGEAVRTQRVVEG